MKPVVLFCPWFGGNFPEYFRPFLRRMNHVSGVELVVPTDQVSGYSQSGNVTMFACDESELIRRLASIGVNWKPGTLAGADRRKPCDLRPVLAAIFPEYVEDCDVWGWCDADIVMGLMAFCLERMASADVYSTAPGQVNGPLTLFRKSTTGDLYEYCGDWRSPIESPNYEFFDEIGFTHAVKHAMQLGACDLKSEYSHSHSGLDDRTSDAPGISIDASGRLWDDIHQREIAFFHFPQWKQWPNVKGFA